METQQGIFQRILNERQPVLRRIMNFYIGFSIIGAISVVISFFFDDTQPIHSINMLLSIAIVGVLIWAKQALQTTRLKRRLQIFLVLMVLLIISSMITSPTVLFLLPVTMLLSMILFSMLGLAKEALWFAYFSTGVFFVVGLINALGYLKDYQTFNPVTNAITITTLAFLFGAGIAMLRLYNDILLQSSRETMQRQQEAEVAQRQAASRLQQSQAQAAEQQRLLALISDLETPAVPVLPGVLALPIVGYLDSHRMVRLTDSLLERVSAERASTLLLDLTSVGLIDTATANHLIQMVRSVRLLGTQCIITGIRAEVAQTMVTLGINWHDIPTSASLQNAIQSILDRQAQ